MIEDNTKQDTIEDHDLKWDEEVGGEEELDDPCIVWALLQLHSERPLHLSSTPPQNQGGVGT